MQETGWAKKYLSRKWRAFVVAFTVSIAVVIAGVVALFVGKQGAGTLITAGFSAMAGAMGFYFTANLMQKSIISKNYKVELDTDVVTNGS